MRIPEDLKMMRLALVRAAVSRIAEQDGVQECMSDGREVLRRRPAVGMRLGGHVSDGAPPDEGLEEDERADRDRDPGLSPSSACVVGVREEGSTHELDAKVEADLVARVEEDLRTETSAPAGPQRVRRADRSNGERDVVERRL